MRGRCPARDHRAVPRQPGEGSWPGAALTRRRRSWCSRRPSPGCPSSAGRHRSCRSRRTRTGRWSEGDRGVSAGPAEQGAGPAGSRAAAGAWERAGRAAQRRREPGEGREPREGRRGETRAGGEAPPGRRGPRRGGREAARARGRPEVEAGGPGPGRERGRAGQGAGPEPGGQRGRCWPHLDEGAEEAGAEVPQVLGDGLQRHGGPAARTGARLRRAGAGRGRAPRSAAGSGRRYPGTRGVPVPGPRSPAPGPASGPRPPPPVPAPRRCRPRGCCGGRARRRCGRAARCRGAKNKRRRAGRVHG